MKIWANPDKYVQDAFGNPIQVGKILMHPANGKRIDEDGSANWPNDQFTKRRVRDGDILLENPSLLRSNTAPPSIERKPAAAASVAGTNKK